MANSADRYVVLDTETTGLDPKTGDRIIEIGVVELEHGLQNRTYHTYLNPKPQKISKAAEAIHGISDADLLDEPKFVDIVEAFLEFIEGASLVIHNAKFDLAFLDNELRLAGKSQSISDLCEIVDTVDLGAKLDAGTRLNLDAIAKHYGIASREKRAKHGALLDAQILASVFMAMQQSDAVLFDDNSNEHSSKTGSRVKWDRDPSKIVIRRPTAEEQSAHEAYMDGMQS